MAIVVGAAQSFYIDEAEVTVNDYAAFAVSRPLFVSEPRCAWKMAPSAGSGSNSAIGMVPVASVDWCDALFYCKSVNKRLCGKIGGGSVSTIGVAVDSPAESQWLRACAGGGGTDRYAYGPKHVSDHCNSESPGVEPVKNRGMCTGATLGVFDLSGNVKEWEDGCDGDGPVVGTVDAARPSCVVRGGSYVGPSEASKCSEKDLIAIHDTFPDIGFRCCKDL
jgi:formylglycine-generating enzyme required for sulfatase activity